MKKSGKKYEELLELFHRVIRESGKSPWDQFPNYYAKWQKERDKNGTR